MKSPSTKYTIHLRTHSSDSLPVVNFIYNSESYEFMKISTTQCLVSVATEMCFSIATRLLMAKVGIFFIYILQI